MTTIFAILIAGIVSTSIGFLWYHPKTFGTAWMRYSGLTPEKATNSMWMAMVGFLASLVMASILYLQTFAEANLARAMLHAAWLWLGFMVPILLGPVLWERKSFWLFAINATYWLTAILGMTIVLQIIS